MTVFSPEDEARIDYVHWSTVEHFLRVKAEDHRTLLKIHSSTIHHATASMIVITPELKIREKTMQAEQKVIDWLVSEAEHYRVKTSALLHGYGGNVQS